MASNPSSWARMSSHPELHLFLRDTRELERLLIVRRSMSELVEAQTIKGVQVGIEVSVEIDGVGR